MSGTLYIAKYFSNNKIQHLDSCEMALGKEVWTGVVVSPIPLDPEISNPLELE